MENIEPGIIVGIIGAAAAIFIAWWRTRSAGASNLLAEYRVELMRIRAELLDVKEELARLQGIINSNYGTLRKEYELVIDELKREVRLVTEKYTKLLRENVAIRERVRELERELDAFQKGEK